LETYKQKECTQFHLLKGEKMNHRLSLESVKAAMQTIPPEFLHTPQFVCEPLSDALGATVILKVETLNPIRSFKGRGAAHFVSSLTPDARLVCASAGNFGQAMAYACRTRGMALTVYASVNANPLKCSRMRALGADVVLAGEDFDAAKLEAKRYAAANGAYMVEDGLEPRISEGAGTIGLELSQVNFDAVLVPLGNGALLNGVARYLKANSKAKVIAVCAAGAPSMLESWQTQKLVRFESISTIADGIGVREPIWEAVQDMNGIVDEGLLVSDSSIIKAMQLLHQHVGLVVEPSGAAGLAALLENRQRFAGTRVATIICGGNLTNEQVKQWL
jgi:threonine dehydratase